MIVIKNRRGDETPLTAQIVMKHGGFITSVVISDLADRGQVVVYGDELDSLIDALQQLREQIK